MSGEYQLSCAGPASRESPPSVAWTRTDVNSNLAEAVQRSFNDGLPVRSCGGIVFLKLTRNARGESGAKMWKTAAGLEECHKAVRESGFEVRPEGPTQ